MLSVVSPLPPLDLRQRALTPGDDQACPTVGQVRGPLTHDDVEATEGHRDPAGHRALADTLLGWAAVVHPDDEPTTAELLAGAGWHLDLAGDTEAALAVFRRSQEAGDLVPDVRTSVVAVLLASGRSDEAHAEAEAFRRTRPSVLDCVALAEVWEIEGDLGQAARWTALGLARLELSTDEDLDAGEAELLLTVRARIRANQGLPPD